MRAQHFKITGTVQGVFFRSKTEEHAKKLRITGWVRNRLDGSVEVHAEGLEENVNTLEEWLHKGPTQARVKTVTRSKATLEGFKTFSVLETQ